MKKITFVVLAFVGSFFIMPNVQAAYGDTTTYLGRPYAGDGSPAVSAYLDFPEDVTADASGNFYIADTANHVIRKIDTAGKIHTVAGTGSYGSANGAANMAEFALPRGVAIDSKKNIYVADSGNNLIRKINTYGVVSTLVSSGLNNPQGVLAYGDDLYIADTGNNAIKTVSTSGGILRVLTNDLNAPKKIAIDGNGTYIYVADYGSHKVKRVTRSTGKVVAIAGSGQAAYAEGTGSAASFQNLWGVAYAAGKLYISDGDGLNDKLRQIDLSNNKTSLLARDLVMASINYPSGLVVYGSSVYIANSGIGTIQKFELADPSHQNSLFAGIERFGNRNGVAVDSLFGRPCDIILSPDRKWLYLAENNKIRKINYTTKTTSALIGNSVDNYKDETGSKARFSNVTALAIESTGKILYAVDRWNNRIRKVDIATQTSSLVSGGGLAPTDGDDNNGYREGVKEAARFNHPAGIAISPNDKYLYVTDSGNNRVRRVTIATGATKLIAGSGQAGFADGKGSQAKFNKPYGLAISADGAYLFLADTNNHAIRRITVADGTVITVAGTGSAGYRDAIGTESMFSYPEYVNLDSAGNIYVSEVGSQRIRIIETNTYITKLVAGSGVRGYENGSRSVARFNNPKGFLVDKKKNVIIATDSFNDVLRQINISGSAPYTYSAPALSSVQPDVVSPNWDTGSGLRIKITGTNFRNGATVWFGTLMAKKTYVVSSTELVAELPLDQMAAGRYDILVKNSDGQPALLVAQFGLMNDSGTVPDIIFSADFGSSFYAYSPTLRGGFNIAVGNVVGDGKAEIITGTGNGLSPQVRVFDGEGAAVGQFFAYDQALRTGVRVASCDLDGNGRDEIVTVPGPGGRPHIRIFDAYGNVRVGSGFFALDGKFMGGANLACGDVNGDGKGEIIVAAGAGGGPHITIHRADGRMIGNFMAYGLNFRGGIRVATAELNTDGKMEVITGPERGGPHLEMFTGTGHQINPGVFAFDKNFGGGLSVATGDTNGDGRSEMIVTPGPEAASLVKIYKDFGITIAASFYLYDRSFVGASNIAAGDINGDGLAEIVGVARSNGTSRVVIFDGQGNELDG
ncbi:MAG: IPT/TIG domain-containing protein [Patescibacteria group bacterium]